nr:low molecular weight protein-tyrosine-phosphatase [Nakamurella aerolata]
MRIAAVCSGNICRSPIAEKVLQRAFTEAGLDDAVLVESFGTGSWHVGQGANSKAVKALRRAGYPTEHTARQLTADQLDELDLVVVADRGHLRQVQAMAADPSRVRLLRSFDPDGIDRADQEVPDPYYGTDADFDEVLAMTLAAAPGVVEAVRAELGR